MLESTKLSSLLPRAPRSRCLATAERAVASSGAAGVLSTAAAGLASAAGPAVAVAAVAALMSLPAGASAQQAPGDTTDLLHPADHREAPPAVTFGSCPDSLSGPRGAQGVAWGDSLAATSLLASEMGAEPLSTADPAALVERGDRAVLAGHHTVGYVAYAAAREAGGGYEALWKGSQSASDVGQDLEGDAARKWWTLSEELGRGAIEARPGEPEGHFTLAQSLGLVALDAGVRQRVRLSEEVRAEARAAIEADSTYAGGWHVLGRWNQGVMELSGAGRFFARTFLGGQVLGEASWEKAAEYLSRAAELEPGRVVHRLELGKVLRERDRPEEARAALRKVLSLDPWDYHDCVYKEQARELLEEMGGV